MIDWFQIALHKFNTDTPNWYAWKKFDSDGNKIPNDQRMTYANIEVIKDGATIPTEAEINAKIQELKDEQTDFATKKASGKSKLKALGLDDEEIKALIG